jgi:ABC-type uncharacterized transport system auxiliary subunit
MKRVQLTVLLAAIAVTAGCGSSMQEKKYYVPDVKRAAQPAAMTHKDVMLEVNRFTIDGAFKSKGLVFRKSDSRYVTSYYTELMQVPAEAFTEETRQWLTQSGMFGNVLQPGSTLQATHVIEGHILEYYIDARTNEPAAVLSVRTMLVKQAGGEGTAALKGMYQAREPMKGSSGEEAVEAMARCTEKVLGELESDLAKAAW